MTRRIAVRKGLSGYRDQLERTRRSLTVLEATPATFEAFEQMLDHALTFFQNCHHLEEWVKHDDALTPTEKRKVSQGVAKSIALKICRDVACGAKHFKLDRPKSGKGASPTELHAAIYQNNAGDLKIVADLLIDDGHGRMISGFDLAHECLNEWISILKAAGLRTN